MGCNAWLHCKCLLTLPKSMALQAITKESGKSILHADPKLKLTFYGLNSPKWMVYVLH